MTNTREEVAVAEAIADCRPLDHYGQAKAAIAASNSKYVPMLVEALKEIVNSEECHEEWYRTIAREALSNLPEELLK